MSDKPKYKRVLIKLSGEALAGDAGFGLNYDIVTEICREIKNANNLGAEIAVVVGGGNFWRGRENPDMDRVRADHMGMLATVLNSLAIADALEQQEVAVRVQTALPMQQIAEPYIRNKAIRHLEKGRVVVFGCGTGNPFFSTDTAAALRAIEINADIVLKATMVDGVYDKDPKKNNDAVKYDNMKFTTILSDNLMVMDAAAASLCRENNIPLMVFSIEDPKNIVRVIKGDEIGTIIKE